MAIERRNGEAVPTLWFCARKTFSIVDFSSVGNISRSRSMTLGSAIFFANDGHGNNRETKAKTKSFEQREKSKITCVERVDERKKRKITRQRGRTHTHTHHSPLGWGRGRFTERLVEGKHKAGGPSHRGTRTWRPQVRPRTSTCRPRGASLLTQQSAEFRKYFPLTPPRCGLLLSSLT